jgi:hypothetical protein
VSRRARLRRLVVHSFLIGLDDLRLAGLGDGGEGGGMFSGMNILLWIRSTSW